MSSEERLMNHPGHSRPERRLAAILVADVAGYSRLMGTDEVGTARVMLEHQAAMAPIVASHGGRIVKTTGDGLLLDFSSIIAAVECAAAIQGLMAERNTGLPPDRQMLFRIGVNVGDVLVEGEDILGDGVNVAARLEAIAEPGGICISDDAYRQVQGKISAQFVDGGEQQLKNISRPMRVYRVFPEGSARALALPDKPSIAVLAFDNMSEASEDIYFADGIAEDIITELSSYPDLFVVARNSSFTYRGKVARITEVARELGVRYILEGSVRRAGSRIRISAQLIDAASGKHLWAQRYDRDLTDLFAIQDEVTQSIVAVLPEFRRRRSFKQAAKAATRWTPMIISCAASTIITWRLWTPTAKRNLISIGRLSSTRCSRRLTPGRPVRSAKRGAANSAPAHPRFTSKSSNCSNGQ
jgi:adenylate cyclase